MIIKMVFSRLKVTLPLFLTISSLFLTFAQPLKIEAKKVINKKNLIIYTGNVKAFYGNQTLSCNELIAYTTNGTKIQRIIAKGDVQYFGNNTEIFGDVAYYYPSNRTVVFIGNVLVKTSKGLSKGDRLIYYLKNNTYEIFSQKLVQTVIDMSKFKSSNNEISKARQNNTAGKR
jgi:lipopolysaccharide transport protein LptA